MKNLQLRLEVKAALQQWVANIMQQNQIPAYVMEDALIDVQLSLKDLIMQDMLIEIREEQISKESSPIEQMFAGQGFSEETLAQLGEEVEQNGRDREFDNEDNA